MGVVPGTRTLVEGGIDGQTIQTMNNIKALVEAEGLQMKDIFKCTVMLSDMAHWPRFNEIYLSFFEGCPSLPTRSAFGANGLALGGLVEVEAWAVRPSSSS